MRSDHLSDVLGDLADWSEPVIADFLQEAYAARLGPDAKLLRTLASTHARFWRALLRGDGPKVQLYRHELMLILRLAALPPGLADQIDTGMLEELMTVTLARFLRSPATARDHGLYMLRLATRLERTHAQAD